jgi:hypothetical protein
MKKVLLVICILLVTVSASFAAPIGNASLKGTYSFQMNNPQFDGWWASINCPQQNGGTYTVNAGGNDVSSNAIVGTMTFDGKGNVKGMYAEYGDFDQAASNATVVPSCTGASNNGYAVYDPATSGTFTGTYSIQPTGLGAMILNPTGGGSNPPNIILQLAGTAAVRTTILLTEYNESNQPYKVKAFGTAVLQ